MNTYLQKLCVWSSWPAMLIFFVGLVTMSFLPPLSPSLTPEEVANIYQTRHTEILIGAILIMISSMFAAPFFAAISMQLRRMEGSERPVMSYAQLATGTALIQFFILPGLLFIVTAYRPDRSIDVTYALNDLAWIVTLIPWPIGCMQAIICGITILKHGSASSVYPRWLGFFNFWMALIIVTPTIVPFFKSGPFAWNGIFGFWIPAVEFGLWMSVMMVMTLKAINTETK